MKKIVCLILILGLTVSFVFAKGKSDSVQTPNPKLICGVTEFEPMNYRDSSGKWIGFDSEFAEEVCKKLGMDVSFQEITWSQKFVELRSGAISCIWNGMTANTVDGTTGRPRNEDVDFSYSYMLNQQCAVIKADRSAEFTSVASLAGKKAAAEKGSAGEPIAIEAIGARGTMIDKTKQLDTFMEVLSGAVDLAVVDSILAHQLVGKGDYAGLKIANISLGSKMEVYAVGFPKGSDLVQKVNKVIKELYDDGTLYKIAHKYGLEESIVIGTEPIE